MIIAKMSGGVDENLVSFLVALIGLFAILRPRERMGRWVIRGLLLGQAQQ